MNVSEEKIVIVGFGWVGQANALALKVLGFDVSYFDPTTPPQHYDAYASLYDSLERLPSIEAKDSPNTWYVICVGDRVSPEGVQDLSHIKSALDSLRTAQGGVVLRSTVLPDLLDDLKFDHYIPEFLHEKKAVEECIHPYFFVIGSRPGSRPTPRFCDVWRAQAHKVFEGTPREASFIKYLSNLWNSVRIAFVNEFGDAIGRPSNKEHLAEIERVIDFLFDRRNYSRYGRAFGGHCLPKDTRAFRTWYEKKGRQLPLIAGVYETNTRHQKLEEEFPLMPEWYSEWPDRHISGWHALRELWYAIRKSVRNPLPAVKRITEKKKESHE